ncbi:MAG: protein-export chaperone SecB, partial [Alphaproteobacteria bacterium]|nr:protein-export chaperone SecB [Alphaproteobacteria bacterium]
MDAEKNQGGASPQATPVQITMNINHQYIKDLSFEVPNGAKTFEVMQNSKPDISINLDAQVTMINEAANLYEVALRIKAECKIGETTGFIAELTYAGIFTVGAPKEHLHPILMIECPRMIFPFARNVLADVTRDGGFPPIMLGPVDFAGLYQARIQELAKQQG